MAALLLGAALSAAAPVPAPRAKPASQAPDPPVGRVVVLWNGSPWDTVIAPGYWETRNGLTVYRGSCRWDPATRKFHVRESRDGETFFEYDFVVDGRLRGRSGGTEIEFVGPSPDGNR